jgi:uroporphyrinogen decarboxylase
MKKDPLYLQATRRHNTQGRPPIWMMRQAGRYMPEYRAIREKHSFLEMVRTPSIATEITLQPIDIFGFDAAILFSDILVTAEALGSHLKFIEKKGPVFSHPTRTMADVEALSTSEIPHNLNYVAKAIHLLKPELDTRNTPLIGFAGAPFTVASYMIEGQSSPDLKTMKYLMMNQPKVVHALLEKLTAVTIDYLNMQLEAGVDALQLFDTWAIHLSWNDFKTFSLPYIEKIVKSIHNPRNCPMTLFCKGSSVFAPLLANAGADVLGIDWNHSLLEVRRLVGPSIALQGNLDPYALYASEVELKKRVFDILTDMKNDPGFIFNLGHGLMPDMNPDVVKKVVDWVKNS